MFQPLIDYFREKSVLILGFGREGRSTFELIRRFLPDKEITIADMNPVTPPDENTRVICGADYLERLGEFELVMKSPGISLRDVDLPKNTEITCGPSFSCAFRAAAVSE